MRVIFLSIIAFILTIAESALCSNIVFIPSKELKLSDKIELINSCKHLAFGFKKCRWSTPLITINGKFSVEPIFVGSPQTGIRISRNFVKTFGDFHLYIDGTEYSISDGSVDVFFPLKTSSNGLHDIKITTSYEGIQDSEDDVAAVISNITLVMDNTNYVNSVLQSVGTLVLNVEGKEKSYNIQKDFNNFFLLQNPQIAALKKALTGRDSDDYSNDCKVNGNGEADPLDPDQCQELKTFNNYLLGIPTGISPEAKKQAFDDFVGAANKLKAALDFLGSAKREYDKSYDASYTRAFNIINKKSH